MRDNSDLSVIRDRRNGGWVLKNNATHKVLVRYPNRETVMEIAELLQERSDAKKSRKQENVECEQHSIANHSSYNVAYAS